MSRSPIVFLCDVIAAAAICSNVHAGPDGTVHEVNLVGVTFEPQAISVQRGDTIRWIRTVGSHTATSGNGCAADGLWFDMPLDSTNPVFEWVVPAEAPSQIPYFCIPHCKAFGMEGTIIIGGGSCEGDVDGDGMVGFVDLLEVLSTWGVCVGCPADVDSNNVIDFGDLLIVLSNWGKCA